MRTERGRDMALADALQQPVWTIGSDGAVDYTNPAWQAYTGIGAEEARGDGWRLAIHPDDLPALRERFAEAQATGSAYEVEYRLRRSDGVFRWHLARVAPLRDGTDAITGWVGIVLDIDDRRRSEAALRASEASYRNIVENASDIIYTLTLDGTIAAVNPAAERVLGYAPGDVLGRKVEELVPADQIDVLRAVLARKLAGEEHSAYDLDILAKDGRRVTLEIDSRLSSEGHQPVIHGIARDVTTRRQVGEGMARLAAIVEDSDDAIVSRTFDGIVTGWNRGAEALYGYSAREIVGQSIDCLVPPERMAEVAELTERLARGERVPHLETVRLRKDGTPVDVSISLSPLTDGQGRLIGVSTIARDVTGSKRAEARLRVLAEAGRVLASDLDVDAQLAAAARLAVPTLADWCVVDIRENGSDLRRVAVAHVDPTKVALAEDLERRYPPDPHAARGPWQVMRTGKPEVMADIPDALLVASARDEEHLRLLREVGFRSYLCVPLRARDAILGTLTFVSTESGRAYGPEDLAVAEALAEPAALAIDNARLFGNVQAAEARYRGLFTGVADAILVANEDRQYLDANSAASRLLGYSREELLTMRVDDVVSAEPSWTQDTYSDYLAEGQWLGELELRRKDGTIVPVEALATVVDLPNERVYLSAVRDITERRRLERLRRDFLAMVTHDLRTPLAAVKGSAQFLKRRGEYRPKQVEAILGASGQMQRLIDDLADVVRLEAGRLTLRREVLDLTQLVREVLDVPEESAPQRVTIDVPPMPVTGEWDRDRLSQVLMNLLDNSLKYAGDAGITVRVEDRGDDARLVVIDRGPGIAPEHLSHLFDPFYRVDATGAGGLGLGLYITRMLVGAHGGRIWAESEIGSGSVFTVALPKRP